MTVRWDREQRDRARRQGKHLICLAVDGREARRDRLDYAAVVDEATAAKVHALILELIREEAGRRREVRR